MKNIKTPRVVAIGASAGGLDAFQKLIENLPNDTGMAFVLLSHILRNSKRMAQEPASAASKYMPINAIRIDHVDHILTPEKIAQQLASMSWCDSNSE